MNKSGAWTCTFREPWIADMEFEDGFVVDLGGVDGGWPFVACTAGVVVLVVAADFDTAFNVAEDFLGSPCCFRAALYCLYFSAVQKTRRRASVSWRCKSSTMACD